MNLINKKCKIKLFLFVVVVTMSLLRFDILAYEVDKNMQIYKETVDKTEYEDVNIVYKFMNMLASYDKQYVINHKGYYTNTSHDFFGCKLYLDRNSNVIQDIRYRSKHNKYAVAVNRANNQVTVYGYDENDKAYNTPVVSFMCTCNKRKTPIGKFYIKEKYDWQMMLNKTFAQYAVRITGNFLFHSVPYNSKDIFDLNIDEYNKLSGEGKSDGCIRLKVEDAYWLYKNLNDHALVVIHDNSTNNEPFERPYFVGITDKNITFDPTDPSITGKW